MWIFGKPTKILFFKKHIKNLIKSLKVYKLNTPNLEKNILKLIKLNIDKNVTKRLRYHSFMFFISTVTNVTAKINLSIMIKDFFKTLAFFQ